MNAEFSKNYYLRALDFDMNSKILPRAVLEIFQDIAGAHAETDGFGFDDLKLKNLFWIIVRTKFIIEKQPKKYVDVKVTTWPLEPKGYFFRRDYIIEDQNGDVLIRGTSDWMILNSESRSLTAAKDIYPEDTVYKTDLAIDEKLKKLRDFKGDTAEYNVTPAFCDIDVNGHVNNTRYADFVINAINPESREIKSFQIDYLKEVLKGEPLTILTGFEDNKAFSKGINTQEEKMFSCEIVFKD